MKKRKRGRKIKEAEKTNFNKQRAYSNSLFSKNHIFEGKHKAQLLDYRVLSVLFK